ncbi:MAG: ACP phosphodiesterase [Crocinitomicaceae bacterium]
MNFLGHAYIARNYPELIAGNFAGDAYKGNLDNFSHLPLNIQKGIKLHRFIDDYTDQSPHILAAGHLLHKAGISRIAYIATDIILDHYLAKNWSQYADIKYADFISLIYRQTDHAIEQLAPEFKHMYVKLKLHGWLFDYPSEKGIQKILTQFSSRIHFKNDLGNCFQIYLKNRATFDLHFSAFLVDINKSSVEFIEQL